MLPDNFVNDELLNTRISNLVGGNMKIVEDYAERVMEQVVNEKVNETKEEFVKNLDKKGFTMVAITEMVEVDVEFVRKTLSK